MSLDVPLTLRLEPGDYQCYASLPDPTGTPVRLGGVLSLQPNRPAELSLHGPVPLDSSEVTEGVTMSELPQVSTLPLMAVDLVRGNDVLLIDCHVNKWGPERAIVTAAAGLVGVRISPVIEDLRVEAFTIQVSSSFAVTVPPPLGLVSLPVDREPDTPLTWSATERMPRRIINTDPDAELSAYWYSTYSGGDGYTHRVSFSPVIEVRMTEPVDLDTLRAQWIDPLRRIIGLATGRVETVTYLDVDLARVETITSLPSELTGERNRELQVFGTNIAQQPYAPRGSDLRDVQRAFCTYRDGDTSLLALCRGWQAAQAERHPLVDTLGTFLSLPPQHPRARLLLLIQALEGTHGHENATEFESQLAHYRVRRDHARAAVKACEALDPKVSKFIRDSLPNWPASSLDRALRHLVGELPLDLVQKLSGLKLVTSLMAEDDRAKDWSSALRIVRNELSHGRRSWDPNLLGPAADLLEIIARAHLMRVIGVSQTAIHDYLIASVPM